MNVKRKHYFVPSGYSNVYLFVDRTFNIFISFLLLILTLPFTIIIGLIIKINSSGPIIYKGIRMGLNKKTFIMYKFRTLTVGASNIIGAELLSYNLAHEKNLINSFGKFLRETRLDELPQLYNILKGDMTFFGPRPIRPEIYEEYCKELDKFDNRFIIKPGLIGYSQLFTPHSSPKRLRNTIDNIFVKRNQNIGWEIIMIVYTIMITIIKTIKLGVPGIWKNLVQMRIFSKFREKRLFDRIRLNEAFVSFESEFENKKESNKGFKIQDINEEACLIFCDIEIPEKLLSIKMETKYSNIFGFRKRIKTAKCKCTLYKKTILKNEPYKYAYVFKFESISEFNKYIIDQYFLLKSIL